jgi:phosphoglycerate dehydrogenase-like enzyme
MMPPDGTGAGRPPRTALLAMDDQDVPDDLRDRVQRAVRPVWAPDWTDRERWPGVEILVTAHADLSAATLTAIPELRTILATSTAVDYIDHEHCAAHGIAVHNTPDYTGSSVAEHAIALMLAVVRHIPGLDAAARGGADPSGLIGRELAGAVAGVVGLGGIGGRVARIVRGLGMDVVFVNRSRRTVEGAVQVDLPTLLRLADVVFLTVPLRPGAGPMLGVAELALMKRSAVLVNVSADGLVDRPALAAALAAGRIAGAGLDVIGSPVPYRDLRNTVLTPTRGWYTAQAVRRRTEVWVDTLCRLAAGRAVHPVA